MHPRAERIRDEKRNQWCGRLMGRGWGLPATPRTSSLRSQGIWCTLRLTGKQTLNPSARTPLTAVLLVLRVGALGPVMPSLGSVLTAVPLTSVVLPSCRTPARRCVSSEAEAFPGGIWDARHSQGSHLRVSFGLLSGVLVIGETETLLCSSFLYH